jgi:magnesium chelatase family protein
VDYLQLTNTEPAERSALIRERVIRTREVQRARQANETKFVCNAQMNPDMVRRHCALQPAEQEILIQAMEKHRLSARSYDRILKVARTIADLEGASQIELRHLSEAIAYRCLDQDYFM